MKKFKVTVDGRSYMVEVEELKDKMPTSNKNRISPPEPVQDSVTIKEDTKLKDKKEKTAEKQPASSPAVEGGYKVKAPMPGSVLDVKVKEGDKIEEGDVLLILEAMKMENEMSASRTGTVAKVLVKKGDAVNSGDPLIIIT